MSAQVPKPEVSPEFFVRVNDFLALANRIGARHTTGHAQVAMVHAFARYSAYHYRGVVAKDSQAEREAFASYMGQLLTGLVADHLMDVVGPIGSEASAEDSVAVAGAGAPNLGASEADAADAE